MPISWLDHKPHAIAVYASWPALPSAHATLATGRPATALPGPVLHRLDCTSFCWRLRKSRLGCPVVEKRAVRGTITPRHRNSSWAARISWPRANRHAHGADLDAFRRIMPILATPRQMAPRSMHSLWTTWLTAVNVAPWWYLGGASMTTIERNSDKSVHDFAWHRTHRAWRGVQLIDVVMLAGWAALIGWVLLRP